MKSIEQIITEGAASDLAREIDRQFFDALDEAVKEEIQKVLSDDKAKIDPEYLHNIKAKVEKVLSSIVKHYGLEDCLSEKYRYRVKTEKLYASIYHKLFEENKDIDGNILRRGYEYIPVDFEDWMKTYLSDYIDTEAIYSGMCGSRRIIKEDLIYLNKIAKKYKVA